MFYQHWNVRGYSVGRINKANQASKIDQGVRLNEAYSIVPTPTYHQHFGPATLSGPIAEIKVCSSRD